MPMQLCQDAACSNAVMAEQTPQYCGKGQEFKAELARHSESVRNMQQQISEIHGATDSIHKHVPRSLHESLTAHMHQRALTQLQWHRHLGQCSDCYMAENPTEVSTAA